MNDRNRLIELIDGFVFGTQIAVNSVEWDSTKVKELADYLLANGVIVPPCKVGDTVYCKYWNGGFVKCTVSMITQQLDKPLKLRLSTNGSVSLEYTVNDLGKLVFLTKEEAEENLKGLNDNA